MHSVYKTLQAIKIKRKSTISLTILIETKIQYPPFPKTQQDHLIPPRPHLLSHTPCISAIPFPSRKCLH